MLDIALLRCPACSAPLREEEAILTCTQCKARYPVENGVPRFVEELSQHTVAAHTTRKTPLRIMARWLRPPHHSVYFDTMTSSVGEGKRLKQLLREHPDAIVLNIGSLSKDLKDMHRRMLNLDLVAYPNVDVVADAHRLPFVDESMDIVLFKNVLEHVRDPLTVMEEIQRVLKPGGLLFIKLPFLQPFHAVPDDYQRYSVSGIKELLKDYEELSFSIAVGPGSMLSWILREWFAVLTSFGNVMLYNVGLIVWGWLTFWLKYTDLLFQRNCLSERVASAFQGVYRKKLPGEERP
ncbi:hypothetical protein COU80_01515 [Candidatus Peregrinibacteria bacterium CG10_big_fil_rev_8_21_14_0_10_55_24]|nr:MAG: hypothetical protein COU80_01515 [Candidatus Peregrinibacteria bacterium CG10_big_fil_rev_8_21_14_0_10_55_24]